MANQRYAILADNCPDTCKVGLYLEPRVLYDATPANFLKSVDFKNLFKNVEYWQSAEFTFNVTAINKKDYFVEHEFNIISNVYATIDNLTPFLQRELDTWTAFFQINDVTIRRMLISFKI